jgi:hypothetical protein
VRRERDRFESPRSGRESPLDVDIEKAADVLDLGDGFDVGLRDDCCRK